MSRTPATCHPDRPVHSRGLCDACRSLKRYYADKAAWKDTRYRRQYGISIAEATEMFDEQGGMCLICREPMGRDEANVDHDHDTGDVRGLLCGSCNRGIGLLGDDPDRLKSAAAYLGG